MQEDGLDCLSCYDFASHRRMDGTSRIISVGFRNLTTVTMITLLSWAGLGISEGGFH